MWEIEFYERATGRCPVREFILEQSSEDRKLISKDQYRADYLAQQAKKGQK